MRALINSLRRSSPPVTVLLTSHNLAEIEELCERVAIISRGRIRAVDTPQHLRTLTRQSERVRLVIRGVALESVARLLSGEVEALETSTGAGRDVLSFTREAGDDTLDRALHVLHDAGAEILACETERGTLLDVLESYEQENESGEAN